MIACRITSVSTGLLVIFLAHLSCSDKVSFCDLMLSVVCPCVCPCVNNFFI